MAPSFMFATGIENSVPTIRNGRLRVDEYEKCGHYKHWREDFALVEDLGVRFLPPTARRFTRPGSALESMTGSSPT